MTWLFLFLRPKWRYSSRMSRDYITSIHSPMAHLSSYGPPSAAILNCLVSPSRRVLRPYPQLSLYIPCLKVPSSAVYLTCLPQCRSDHHYSTVYSPVIAGGSISTTFLQFSLRAGSLHLYTCQSLFSILARLSH